MVRSCNPSIRRLRQEELQFEDSLHYIGETLSQWTTINNKSTSKREKLIAFYFKGSKRFVSRDLSF
jgi:hypothetical protein